MQEVPERKTISKVGVKKMHITLIFPPHWSPYQPYLSIPSLTGFLRDKGYNVTQRDLNIECIEYFTSTGVLKKLYQKIEKRIQYLKGQKNLNKDDEKELKNITPWQEGYKELLRSVKGAKDLIRDRKKFYDFKLFQHSSLIFSKAYEMVGDAYYPTIMDFYYMGQKYSPTSTEGILKAIEDRSSNQYIDYFESHTIPSFSENPSDFYGISITDFTQVIPGFTLAKMLKQTFPNAHICIGGNVFTRLGPRLVPDSPLAMYFDSIILYEGETALEKLIQTLEGKEEYKNIPNTIYKDTDGKLIHNDWIEPVDINSLPAPDYTGLPLDKYLSPSPVFALLTARGCYWNKCTFCQHKYNYQGGYRPRKIKKVISDIKLLKKKHGSRFFTLNDEAIAPPRLRGIGEKLIEENIDICWEGHGRSEKNFQKDLATILAKSGCKMMSFGLESSSCRVLDLMQKGIDIEVLKNILTYTAEAGILNHIWFFTGFPSETEDEARATADFILEHQDIIHSVPFNVVFGLEGDTDIINNPKKYGLKEVRPLKDRDLTYVYEYSVMHGMSQEEAELLAKELEKKLRTEHKQGLMIYSLTGTHKMLYADHFGTNNLISCT